MNLIYSTRILFNRIAFCDKVRFISEKLGIEPNWLMAVMYLESSLNHRAVNIYSNATGLIQFMPATARQLGTTTDQLLQMSNVEQLDFVLKYLYPYKDKIKSFCDLYLTIFFPLAIGKGADFVLKTKKLPATLIAKQNRGYDLNGNFEITVSEVEKAILKRINPDYHKFLL
jgi:hypothetical protein